MRRLIAAAAVVGIIIGLGNACTDPATCPAGQHQVDRGGYAYMPVQRGDGPPTVTAVWEPHPVCEAGNG